MSTPPPTPVLPSLAIVGRTDRFPVRRVLCIGRNYAAHAREMGATGREAPFHFAKSPDAVLPADAVTALPYPSRTADLHHEIELVVALGAGGRDVSPEAALDLVYGYAAGLDMTRRDVQDAAKKAGRPWTASKDFDASAVVGPVTVATGPGRPGMAHPTAGPVSLSVDGTERQRGDLTEMIWNVAELLAELSAWGALRPGDLVFTGTPSGVGPVRPGQRLVGRVLDLPELVVDVVGG